MTSEKERAKKLLSNYVMISNSNKDCLKIEVSKNQNTNTILNILISNNIDIKETIIETTDLESIFLKLTK